MNDEVNRDMRQLQHMLDCISAVREGRISLIEAADTLLFLRDALSVADAPWSGAFTSHVATLESAGLATDDQKSSMGSGFETVIAQTLGGLEQSIRAHPAAATVPSGAHPG